MAANRIPQPLGPNDLVEAYICYRKIINGLQTKHFYLALNGSKRDKEDYLAWVETDQEGRIRNRIKRFNWGKADRRAYQDRERKNEAFLRDDGIRVAFVQLNNDGSCVVRYENSTGNWCMRTFRPYLPAGKYDLIHRCFVA